MDTFYNTEPRRNRREHRAIDTKLAPLLLYGYRCASVLNRRASQTTAKQSNKRSLPARLQPFADGFRQALAPERLLLARLHVFERDLAAPAFVLAHHQD